MTAKNIDGKSLAKALRQEIAANVTSLKGQGIHPGLAVVLVGEDPASQVYVGHKAKACNEVGIYSEIHTLPSSTTQTELLELINKLNLTENIHGILVQLPLPGHLNEKEVIMAISPKKDVDGFHPINAGALAIGEKGFVPCTPKGCIYMLKSLGVDLSGKKAVVVGRSNIVGKPMSFLMLQENATVTICHSRTKNLAEETRQADILIAAIGRANFITADMVKEGAIVLDVGINRLNDGKLAGDVDFDNVASKTSWITPVPGGVGPMTIAMLLVNTLEAAGYEQ